MLEQAARCSLDEIQDLLESVGAAVIGIWNLRRIGFRRIFEKQANTPAHRDRDALVQYVQILSVHREDEIEEFEVFRFDGARAQRGQIVSAAARRFLRPRIRRLTDVIGGSTGRICVDPQSGRFPRRNGAEHRFSGGRPADVS